MSVTIYVPDIPEFAPLVRAADGIAGCTVLAPQNGYWRLQAEREIAFSRKKLGLGPALWNSALSGGFRGRIVEYGRHELRIVDEQP